jgi:serine/threonine protein phosphatase PrpC
MPFIVRLFKKQNEIQLITHDLTAADRVKWADLTLCAICSDGVTQIMSNTTVVDIKHKMMIENNGNLLNLIDPKFQLDKIGRYQKYIDRGYQDINNVIYNKLVNETSTN